MAPIEYAAPFTMEEMTAGMIETTGLDRDTVIAWMNAVWGPDSVQARAGRARRRPRSRQRLHEHARLARRLSSPAATCSRTLDRWHGCMRPR